MDKKLLFFACLLIVSKAAMALNVSVTTFQFKRQDKFYLDVNLRIIAQKLTYRESAPGQFDAQANVLITIQPKGSNDYLSADKYQLSAKVADQKKDLLDVRTYALLPGEYVIGVEISDQLDSTNMFRFTKNVAVGPMDFSDVFMSEYVEKKSEGPLVKNGYYMEPLTHYVVDETQRNLQFYTEIYLEKVNPTKELILAYSVVEGIQPSEGNKEVMVKFKKVKQAEIIPILAGFDLNYLISGDYHLKLAIMDENKKEVRSVYAPFINRNLPGDIAKKRTFNQYYQNSFVENMDSVQLRYCLLSLAPLHTTTQAGLLNQVIKEGTIDQKKYYLFKYWKESYPKSPQAAFEFYMKVAKLVDEKYYNTVGYGFQTDRGHIYLKHGKPNKVVAVDDEANTPPYEIWFYHYLPSTNQTNIRFIFYSPQLNEEYALLHSNCYGERKNPRWEVELYRNAVGEQEGDIREATTMQANFNRKARMLWDSQ